MPNMTKPTLINAQPDIILPITHPVAIAAPVPTRIPPKKATTVCSGGFGSNLQVLESLAELQEPATSPDTNKINHQETFFPFGFAAITVDSFLSGVFIAVCFCQT